MKTTGKKVMAVTAAGLVMAGVMSTTVMAHGVTHGEYCTEENVCHDSRRCDNMKEKHYADHKHYEDHQYYEDHHRSHHGR